MAKPDTVKIINGMLDDFTDHHGKQTIILRGSIDLSTLANLKRDDYQRDRFSAAELKKLTAAIEAGKPVADGRHRGGKARPRHRARDARTGVHGTGEQFLPA